ncbi:CRISPR-associated endonuclease Cas1 [Sulfodiicoccus acidiphilus]|uniref:CRISPR-associated endonuclease Cas1 n=1 Tax=Sulfodiicoccus acidiphilus TaxID=1670455 RepID=A0A830H2H0_9CREN|nr:CRISPR-associated endonuclease Cas1 [Sulfodiicoccus acidiphilus]GGU00930.1 CRISPR-associated endonuclease Cas1 [Sulfodiicoccus acidiphilus]
MDEWGAFVGTKDGLITCSVKGTLKWAVSPVELDALVFQVTAAVSTEVVKLANEHGVDLVFMDHDEPVARVVGAKFGGSPKVWVAQLRTKRSAELAWSFVRGKVRNQLTTLRYYQRKYGGLELEAMERTLEASPSSREEAMQLEAAAAKVYWLAVKKLIPPSLKFPGRRFKRRAEDPFNVALNIGYGLLRAWTWRAVVVAGLLPYVGFLHKYRPGRPSLVFDLMEEFRSPLVDRPLIALARTKPEDLTSGDRKPLLRVLLESVRREDVLHQARKLARCLLDGSPYTPYVAK